MTLPSDHLTKGGHLIWYHLTKGHHLIWYCLTKGHHLIWYCLTKGHHLIWYCLTKGHHLIWYHLTKGHHSIWHRLTQASTLGRLFCNLLNGWFIYVVHRRTKRRPLANLNQRKGKQAMKCEYYHIAVKNQLEIQPLYTFCSSIAFLLFDI